MNAKENNLSQPKLKAARAREIISECEKDNRQHSVEYWEAKGYLDCYEQVKPLVQALEEVSLPPYKDSDANSILETLRIRAETVLKQWRKGQGEE